MKFIVSSSELLKQLQTLSALISNNNALPILNNFLFELQENELKVTATDLETTLISYIKVSSDTSGKTAVPAKLITDMLKTFAEQPLTLSLKEDKNSLEITAEQGHYSLAVQNSEEFPKSPVLEEPNRLTMKTEVLSKAINQTLFASSSDELRPVMTGVLFQLGPEGATFVATDAHKLVKYVRKDLKANQITEFILPKKPLQLLKNMLDTGEVTIEHNEANTRFIFDNKTLICRLIDGKYPDYKVVIPKDNNKTLSINRTGFLNALKRITLFSNKSTYQICLQLSGNELQMYAEDLDFSNKAQERFNCDYKGEDMKIGFNSKFLIEMLAHLDAEDIIFKMSNPNSAGILKPSEDKEEGEETLMLVMPITLGI